MKQSFFIAAISGLILMLSFQNCSQGNFESSSSSNTQASTNKAISDEQIQNFLARDRVEICPAIACAAPPENCHYEQDSSTNGGIRSRCISSCGRLVCDRQPPIGVVPPKASIICPMIACSAVPTGCKRVAAATTVRDTNGCDLNCGEIKCDEASTEPVINPVDGNNDQSDDSVQQIGIGTKPRICPMVMCAAPPEGCFYRPTSRLVGTNECPGCGELICKKPPFGTDLPPVPVE